MLNETRSSSLSQLKINHKFDQSLNMRMTGNLSVKNLKIGSGQSFGNLTERKLKPIINLKSSDKVLHLDMSKLNATASKNNDSQPDFNQTWRESSTTIFKPP